MMTPNEMMPHTLATCMVAPVVPVITVNNVADAAPLAAALVKGGLPALEVTLRTDCALDAIAAMAEVEGAIPGVGTLLTVQNVKDAVAAGAKFGVSPGATDTLLSACEAADLPTLPGACTASEAMALLERGYTLQKFFPAEANGGVPALKAIGAPLQQIKFCPTGGVSLKNAPAYLALSNTVCVGGSWVVPNDAIEAGDWDRIAELAAEAALLTR